MIQTLFGVIKLPLTLENGSVYDADNRKVIEFDTANCDTQKQEQIVRIVNERVNPPYAQCEYHEESGEMFADGKRILTNIAFPYIKDIVSSRPAPFSTNDFSPQLITDIFGGFIAHWIARIKKTDQRKIDILKKAYQRNT